VYLFEVARQTAQDENNATLIAARIFGAFIRSWRFSLNADRCEISDRAHLDRQVWVAIEGGRVPMGKLQMLFPKIAQGLGCREQTLGDMMGEAMEKARRLPE